MEKVKSVRRNQLKDIFIRKQLQQMLIQMKIAYSQVQLLWLAKAR